MTNPAVITGIATILTALVSLIGLVIKLISDLRQNTVTLKQNTVTTQNTNRLVNNSHDEQTARLNQLTTSIENMGAVPPVDPAIQAAKERIGKHNQAQE